MRLKINLDQGTYVVIIMLDHLSMFSPRLVNILPRIVAE